MGKGMDGSATFKKENLPETQLTFIDLSFNQFSFLITQPPIFRINCKVPRDISNPYFLSFPKSKIINLISQIYFGWSPSLKPPIFERLL